MSLSFLLLLLMSWLAGENNLPPDCFLRLHLSLAFVYFLGCVAVRLSSLPRVRFICLLRSSEALTVVSWHNNCTKVVIMKVTAHAKHTQVMQKGNKRAGKTVQIDVYCMLPSELKLSSMRRIFINSLLRLLLL